MYDFLSIIAPRLTEKHLGGQHDQQTHAGGKGGGGAGGDLASAQDELSAAKKAVSARMREAKASGDYSGMSQLRKKVAAAEAKVKTLQAQGAKAGEIEPDEKKILPISAPAVEVPKAVEGIAQFTAPKGSDGKSVDINFALDKNKGKYSRREMAEDLALADPRDLGARHDGMPMRISVMDNTRRTTDGSWNSMTDSMNLLIGKNTQRSTIRETLLHEIGHRAQYRRRQVNDPSWHKVADAAYERRRTAPDGFIIDDPFGYPADVYKSSGRDKGRREFFAQAYATYRLRPDRMKELDLELFDYFSTNVFTGS